MRANCPLHPQTTRADLRRLRSEIEPALLCALATALLTTIKSLVCFKCLGNIGATLRQDDFMIEENGEHPGDEMTIGSGRCTLEEAESAPKNGGNRDGDTVEEVDKIIVV